MTATIQQSIDAALSAMAGRQALANVFLVACGGSFAQMHAPKFAMDREASSLVADAYNSAEFVLRDPPRLGARSVVILCSSSGNTPETVAAARFARDRGAYTIGLTTKPDSPLAESVDVAIGYESKPTVGSADAPMGILLRLVFGLLRDREGNGKYPALLQSLAAVPAVVAKAQADREADIKAWAGANKREPVIYTMASGVNYGIAYSFAICILQEMQWIHSQGIHAGEYFHGPFEITDEVVPFILLQSAGASRKVDERALSFTRKFTDRILLLDAQSFNLAAFDPAVAEYLEPLIFQPVLRMYAIRLAEERGHPLTVRRYMWKMEY